MSSIQLTRVCFLFASTESASKWEEAVLEWLQEQGREYLCRSVWPEGGSFDDLSTQDKVRDHQHDSCVAKL